MNSTADDAVAWSDDLALLATCSTELINSIAAMSDADVRSPSGLPGWSRGHVLAHLEGNARGIGRLARWARDGFERPMYITRDVRNSDVDLHSDRSRVRHQAAVAQSIDALAGDLAALSEQQRESMVVLGNGMLVPAASLARHRLQEVCIHHSDLGIDTYTWRNWPTPMAERMIGLVIDDFVQRDDFPVARVVVDGPELQVNEGGTFVSGPAVAMLAWLLGRDSGTDLTAHGVDAVPAVPAWR